jgi:hypothetical protein
MGKRDGDYHVLESANRSATTHRFLNASCTLTHVLLQGKRSGNLAVDSSQHNMGFLRQLHISIMPCNVLLGPYQVRVQNSVDS